MRILVLSDNETAAERLYTENGLSLYIEFPDTNTRVLFGFGESDKFIKNARRLKVELSDTVAVLPHARSVVAGGFDAFAKIHPRTPVFAQKTAGGEYLVQRGMFKSDDSPARNALARHIGRVTLFPAFTQLHPRLFAVQPKLFSPAPVVTQKNFIRGEKAELAADTFEHEIVLVAFPTGQWRDGCVVMAACCRRGLANVLETVRYYWEDAPVVSVVGGFHFVDTVSAKSKLICGSADIEAAASAVRKYVGGSVYACHCGGGKGYERLEELLAGQAERLRCGEELSF